MDFVPISHFNYSMSCNNAKKRKWQKKYVIVANGFCGHNWRTMIILRIINEKENKLIIASYKLSSVQQ
jgi:hypothetical protein